MAYSEKIAAKIRHALAHVRNVNEKKMFGGLAFMINNKMCIAANADRIMCRIDPALHETAVQRPGCRTVVMKGRHYKGYVYVNDDSLRTKKDFDYWIGLALDFNKRARSSKKRRPQD